MPVLSWSLGCQPEYGQPAPPEAWRRPTNPPSSRPTAHSHRPANTRSAAAIRRPQKHAPAKPTQASRGPKKGTAPRHHHSRTPGTAVILGQPYPFRGRAPRPARSELGPPPLRETHLAQSCLPGYPGPASRKGPTGPTLRANPCPEVTDQDCRFPLPTFIYRLEAPNLGDLMRRWVQSVSKQGLRRTARPAPRERAAQPPRIPTRVTSSLASFTDWRWCTGRHKNCVALRPPCGLLYHHPLLAS